MPAVVADRGRAAVTDLEQRVWVIRCSASRTAGRETPSTSASRRSLGSDSPGPSAAGDDLVEDLVEDLVGDRAAEDGLEGHASGR